MKALIIGDGPTLEADLERFNSSTYSCVIALNKQTYKHPSKIDYSCSLHHDYLGSWRNVREEKGYNMDFKTVSSAGKPDILYPGGNMLCGSTGLFAAFFAIKALGAKKCMLAGVPLSDEYAIYRKVWEKYTNFLLGRVYSLSGWTRQLLGENEEDLLWL